MTIMISKNFEESLAQDIYGIAWNAYHREPTMWPELCEVIPLNTGDGMKGTAGIGLDILDEISDTEEADVTTFHEGYPWRIRIRSKRKKFVITEDMLSDANKAKFAQTVEELGNSWGEMVRLTEELDVSRLFNKGTLTVGDLEAFDGSFTDEDDAYPKFIYDSVPWFDGAHPLFLSATTTFSNITTSLTITKTNIETVYEAMTITNAMNERNQEIVIQPDTILTSPKNRFTLDAILGSQYGVDANLTINVIKGLVTPKYWRFIEDTDAWFMGKLKKGIKFFDRMPMRITVVKVPNKPIWEVEVKRRYGVGVVDWRYWYACNQADS